MKKHFSLLYFAAQALILGIAISSCEKKPVNYFYPNRIFTPTSISIIAYDTVAQISWPASLYTNTMHVTYTVQIGRDSTFQTAPDVSLVADTNFVYVTDDTLADRVKYFVRVRANATAGADSSNWVYSTSSFMLTGVQIFGTLLNSDILDNAVRLSWTPTPGVNLIVLTSATGDTIRAAVSTDENTQGEKIISGLTPGTTYTAQIFAGSKSKGILSFTTKPALTGNIIDLRSISGRPTVLFDTLPQIPSGSIVLLARGQTYTIPSTYTFDRTVTIMSGMGFSTPAVLLLSSNFDATGNIDSLRFSDLTIATSGAQYFMNVGNKATIGVLSLVNCTSQGTYTNSFIRLKTAGDTIRKLYVNNCILDSIGIQSKYAMFYANASSSAVIDNIEIHNSTFYNFYYFIREDNVHPTSCLVDHCTF
ncbi:MAG: DUF4957 domain-containing protein, partial [Thermoflavifilum sp.]|nr:DUF4957 domain-containing protein [Thermoflavifilum sp.]